MIISFIPLSYNKYNNLAFASNNKILDLLLSDIFLLAIN